MSLHRSFLMSSALIMSLLLVLAGSSRAQVFNDVISFGRAASNPAMVTPTQGRDGKLYGTTSNDEADATGTLFRTDTSGVRLVLHKFESNTASQPPARLP